MKKIHMLKKYLLIISLLVFYLFVNKSIANAANTMYDKTTATKAGDVVYFEKTNDWGDNIYIYAWDHYQNAQNQLGGSFPGVKMTLVEGNLYKYEFTSDTAYTQVIFSDGLGKQTADLDYICNGYIYKATSNAENLAYVPKDLKIGDTVYFEKANDWGENIYVHMWKEGEGEYDSWHTIKMNEVANNLYSYTLNEQDAKNSGTCDMIIFSDDNKQTKNLKTVDNNLIFKVNDTTIGYGDDYWKYDGVWLYSSTYINKLQAILSQNVVSAENVKYYTEDSYKAYKEQYELAQEVVNSNYVVATYYDLTSQYDKSLIALPFAYSQLEIDTTILTNKINEMKQVDTQKYAPSLVEAFNKSITDAESIVQNPDNITVSMIKDAISEMEKAHNNLVVDNSELEKLINEANQIDGTMYTDESAKILLDAIKEATEVLENDDASYQEVQEQIAKLEKAIEGLEIKKDDNKQEENKSQDNNEVEVKQENSSNPHTGDIIYAVIIMAVLATGVYAGTTIYLKKQKNRK